MRMKMWPNVCVTMHRVKSYRVKREMYTQVYIIFSDVYIITTFCSKLLQYFHLVR